MIAEMKLALEPLTVGGQAAVMTAVYAIIGTVVVIGGILVSVVVEAIAR